MLSIHFHCDLTFLKKIATLLVMNYSNIMKAIFLTRPNRFLAHCLLENEEIIVHVPNTGRCAELLVNGATVYLQHHDAATSRKTAYTLISVEHNGKVINIDSQAPNYLLADYLYEGNLLPQMTGPAEHLQREKRFGQARFDLYLEYGTAQYFAEVKGVTLMQDEYAVFPDAPTLRGIKHIQELIEAVHQGYHAYLIFIIQMQGAKALKPNWQTHPAFGQAMREAMSQGVQIVAYECMVTPDSLNIQHPLSILV